MRNYQSKYGQRKSFVTQVSNILNRQLPSALIKRRNPLFECQLKLLMWPQSSQIASDLHNTALKMNVLRQYTYNIGCISPVAFAFLSTFTAISDPSLLNFLVGLALLADVGFSLFSNFYYAVAAINITAPQAGVDLWELLRLTSLTETDILLGTYAIIQIRIWRVVVQATAIRIFLGLSLILALVYNTLIHYRESTEPLPLYILIILIVAVLMVGYMPEPLWRMRAVVLIGMAAASWTKDYGIAALVAFVGIIAFLFTELGLCIGIAWFATLNAVPPTDSYSRSIVELLTAAFYSVLAVIGLFLFFKAAYAIFFYLLKRIAFRR